MSKKETKKDSIDKIIDNTFDHIKDIVDANTVIGSIVELGANLYIVPVSRISVGMISGGGVMPKGKNNISAGSGTGFNIEPIGFITVSNNAFDFIAVNKTSDISKNLIESIMAVYEKVLVEAKERDHEEE